jgi:hypothetical protein
MKKKTDFVLYILIVRLRTCAVSSSALRVSEVRSKYLDIKVYLVSRYKIENWQ